MSLERRLDALEATHDGTEWTLELWLYSIDGQSVLGPGRKVYTVEEAKRLQAEHHKTAADITIDLRQPREP